MSEVVQKPASYLADMELFNRLEVRLLDVGGAVRPRGVDFDQLPTTHRFTPGLYIREITMPTGTVLVTEHHITEHPFVVSKGYCSVYNPLVAEWVHLKAPHTGITKPGTKRFLIVHEETIWTTFHPTDETDVETIENTIFAPRCNPLLCEEGEK